MNQSKMKVETTGIHPDVKSILDQIIYKKKIIN